VKTRVPFSGRARRGLRPARPLAGRLGLLAALAAGLLSTPAAHGQAPPPGPGTPEVIPAYAKAVLEGGVVADPNVTPAGCASCGGGSPIPAILGSGGPTSDCACGDTCGGCRCKPGKPHGGCPVDGCPQTCIGRFFHGIQECVCCPDPCYQPKWVTTANSAFFMDTVRPQTYTRFRWDANRNVTLPDRAEFLWARIAATGGGKGPPKVETRLDYDDLALYQEVAAGNFAFFIETTYRSTDPEVNNNQANFGDINLGTKSLLIDCELLQLAFQFRTYIPTGNSHNGLGTGHTSLEPSLLASLKLNQDTYLQTQVAYWIPIGGDGTYEGATWHYHLSLNHLWYKWGAWQLIGTSELNGWTFTDGALTVPPNIAGVQASGETYLSAGGGLRLVFCENMDLGFGAAFALTDDHFARELYRTEFRIRY
jgi:hypothetical protein